MGRTLKQTSLHPTFINLNISVLSLQHTQSQVPKIPFNFLGSCIHSVTSVPEGVLALTACKEKAVSFNFVAQFCRTFQVQIRFWVASQFFLCVALKWTQTLPPSEIPCLNHSNKKLTFLIWRPSCPKGCLWSTVLLSAFSSSSGHGGVQSEPLFLAPRMAAWRHLGVCLAVQLRNKRKLFWKHYLSFLGYCLFLNHPCLPQSVEPSTIGIIRRGKCV